MVCNAASPTKDDVHGIKFIDDRSGYTEEFSNPTEAEHDAELMEKGRFEPATDDEELSELEYDDQSIRKTTATTFKADQDSQMEEEVSLKQFVTEMETLTETDMYDWSETEANIVRKLSGDFGRLLQQPMLKESTKPKTSKKNSATARSRKRAGVAAGGKKKSDNVGGTGGQKS